MLAGLKYYSARNLIYVCYSGQSSSQEHLDTILKAAELPGYQPTTRFLVDFRKATYTTGSYQDILAMIDTLQSRGIVGAPGAGCAALVESDLLYGVLRMYLQAASTRLNFASAVFRNEQDALFHLDQPERTLTDFFDNAV